MAETLIRFDTPMASRDGHQYRVQACGRKRENGQWEAWLEFEEITTGEVLRSQRETTQPNRVDAAYWATGLTPVYLEGALSRMLNPPRYSAPAATAAPFFDGPAPRRRAVVSNREPILDPFSVYEKNPELLAQELTALHGRHLRQIIRDFDLADERDGHLEAMSDPELGSLILQRVRELNA